MLYPRNDLPVLTRIDILANALVRVCDVATLLIESQPLPDGKAFKLLAENLEKARADAQRCMGVQP